MPKRTPPKRRGPRRAPPSPNLVFEPWTRSRQQSVIGGIAAIFVLMALVVWMSRESNVDTPAPPPFDVAARRASLAESTAAARDAAFARVSWGSMPNATPVSLGDAAPVQIPVTDGRALASIGIALRQDGKRPFVMLSVAVFSGDRRLFGNTLNARDAAGSTDAVTLSFNAEAVRAAGVGSDPLTVRVEGFDTGSSRSRLDGNSGDTSLGEARLVIAQP